MKNGRTTLAANIIAVVGVVSVLLFGGYLALTNTNLEHRLEAANDNSQKLYQQLIAAGIPPAAPATSGTPSSIVGDTGPRGFPGRDGVDGFTGATGKDGVGIQGLTGIPGTSITGSPGVDGAPGAPGAPGKDGTNGVDGAPGAIPQSLTIIAPSGTIYVCTPPTPTVPTYTCIVQATPTVK